MIQLLLSCPSWTIPLPLGLWSMAPLIYELIWLSVTFISCFCTSGLLHILVILHHFQIWPIIFIYASICLLSELCCISISDIWSYMDQAADLDTSYMYICLLYWLNIIHYAFFLLKNIDFPFDDLITMSLDRKMVQSIFSSDKTCFRSCCNTDHWLGFTVNLLRLLSSSFRFPQSLWLGL